jgi:hypothetical protein
MLRRHPVNTLPSSARARRLILSLLFGILGAATLAVTGPLFVRLASSTNSTARVQLPSRIESFTERDDLAYPFHRALGIVFGLAPATAEAAAVQWLKAASHARSPDEMARAVRGMMQARDRAGDPATVTARLCTVTEWMPTVTVWDDTRALQAIRGAGVVCRSPR